MRRFVEGAAREQSTLFPECLDDRIDENDPVQVIDVFVDELDLAELGLSGVADLSVSNGHSIRQVCARFIVLCRTVGLFTQASVAIDGSKFKAVNNRDKNFTRAKMERRMTQIEESVTRYPQQLDTADRQEPSEALKTKTTV